MIKDCKGNCNDAGGNPCASHGVCCCVITSACTYADACQSCGATGPKYYSGNAYCDTPLGVA